MDVASVVLCLRYIIVNIVGCSWLKSYFNCWLRGEIEAV